MARMSASGGKADMLTQRRHSREGEVVLDFFRLVQITLDHHFDSLLARTTLQCMPVSVWPFWFDPH
jgi:hypothetical protein